MTLSSQDMKQLSLFGASNMGKTSLIYELMYLYNFHDISIIISLISIHAYSIMSKWPLKGIKRMQFKAK